MFSSSLFNDHELLLSNELVSIIPALSRYGAFVETLLNYGAEANQ